MRLPQREAAFLEASRARRLGRAIEWHDALGSTQDRLRELADAGGGEGALVVADVQTAGRGRKGDPWSSQTGGLWASVLLYPKGTAQEAAALTLVFARAVRETLHFDFCLPATIKEPNDVLVGGRKICGILADATSRAGAEGVERVILGFGLNVANPLPPELEGLATSMGAYLNTPPPLEHVLARVIERFEAIQ
jgi:BirA family biotin operon repressor/biotin-[acetyl-CoA-carboxylase] ligase